MRIVSLLLHLDIHVTGIFFLLNQLLELFFVELLSTPLSKSHICLINSQVISIFIESSCFAGTEWHPRIRNEQNHFIYNDLPRFIMDSYEECRHPPRLHVLDKYGPFLSSFSSK